MSLGDHGWALESSAQRAPTQRIVNDTDNMAATELPEDHLRLYILEQNALKEASVERDTVRE